MSFFFRPKSRVTASRTTATVLNALNILSPTLLMLAVLLIVFAPSGETSPGVRNLMVLYSGILVATSLTIRIVWGIAVRRVRKRSHEAPNDKL